MSNFYVIADEKMENFRKEDGSWTSDMNEAEQVGIERAVDLQLELIAQKVITEICEVPLMHESIYADIHSRVDDVQAAFDAAGVQLETEIGQGDETTWTFRIPSSGFCVRLKLTGPDDFEVITDEDF